MSDTEKDGATPPDGGRMNHDAMRRASELPVEGPAATDTLAASGGLERPGRVMQRASDDQQADRANAEREYPPTAASIDKVDREQRKEK
jgi:hypothetical protein